MNSIVRLAVAAALSATLGLGACASPRLGSAQKLGAAGAEAGSGLMASAAAVESGFQEGLRQDRFLRGLQASAPETGSSCYIGATSVPATTVPRSEVPPALVAQVSTALRARSAMAKSLGETYSAWTALAQYDAYGQVQAGVDNVVSAANGLRAVWELDPIAKSTGAIASGLAGAFASQAQERRLLEASAQLGVALKGYREALMAGQDPTVSLMRDQVGQRYALTIALWRRGFLDANGLVGKLGQGSGLTVQEADPSLRITASDERMCAAVRAYLEGERNERLAAVNDDYAGQVAVVDELIALHERFEKNGGMDVEHLTALVERLTVIAALLAAEEADDE